MDNFKKKQENYVFEHIPLSGSTFAIYVLIDSKKTWYVSTGVFCFNRYNLVCFNRYIMFQPVQKVGMFGTFGMFLVCFNLVYFVCFERLDPSCLCFDYNRPRKDISTKFY